MQQTDNTRVNWTALCKLGGVAALGTVIVGLTEIIITFLPGGNTTQATVIDWYRLFQTNEFMGLRDLGLMNMLLNALAVPIYLALFVVHRLNRYQPYAALIMIIAFLGIGIFYATNRAFPMFALSRQYAAATTDSQRTIIEAAGQSMLAVGQSHTSGTFLSFLFAEMAGILISIVMLKSGIFGKVNAWVGIVGFGALLVFEYYSSFVLGFSSAALLLALVGGLCSLAWDILLARRLFQLGRNPIEYPKV